MTSSLFVNNLMIMLLPAPVIPKKATIAAMSASNKDLAIDTKESVETSYFVARPRTLKIVLAAKNSNLDQNQSARLGGLIPYCLRSQEGMVISIHTAPNSMAIPCGGRLAQQPKTKRTVLSASLS